MIKYYHIPLAHLLGYTKGGHKKRRRCKRNSARSISWLLSKEIQYTNFDFAYFCGVGANFSFPSAWLTIIIRAKAREVWLVMQWHMKASLIPGVWNPLPSLQQISLMETHPYKCFACSTSEQHLSSICLCLQLCDNKTGALRGRHSFPSFQLPPRKHFQQHTTIFHSSSASNQGGA